MEYLLQKFIEMGKYLTLVIFLTFFDSSSLFSQVGGRIVDAKTKQPLVGANIYTDLGVSNMANIRIDADGLQNNISSMRAYINELDSLNARTQTLMTQIASSWEGEASTAYINIMTERIQKAGQMKELLQEFISYMESTRTKFVSRDQESSYSIRGC